MALGPPLVAFHLALERLYLDSVTGAQPRWVSRHLDQGKPEAVIAYGRMDRFRGRLPGVIRPDLLQTETGHFATELDAVPGGIGLTACLNARYAAFGYPIVGTADSMVQGFNEMIRSVAKRPDPSLAIVVSDESKDYRPEMRWLGAALKATGAKVHVVEPEAVTVTGNGLAVQAEGHTVAPAPPAPIDVVYRFFELFDLDNIPTAGLILDHAARGGVAVTPPFKTFLEEKMAFALLHHPDLQPFWRGELGDETVALLMHLFPQTWVMDPQASPPDLMAGGRPAASWDDLARCSQTERRLVVKPSGFSPQAWGSRGVSVGHDLPREAWTETLTQALAAFPATPHVIQRFSSGRSCTVSYYDPEADAVRPMAGRARISPYYFIADGKARLAGALATVCPLNKKLIHGMTEAVMAPCAVRAA